MSQETEIEAGFFRLLDLLPELRSRIYHYVFESSPRDINLLAAEAFAPPAAVTAVSRQLRKETCGLHERALNAFWTDNTFYVSIVFEPSSAEQRAERVSYCKRVRTCGLRRLEFRINQPSFTYYDTWHGAVCVDEGRSLTWKWWRTGGANTALTAISESTAHEYHTMRWFASMRRIECASMNQAGGLDVGNCVTVFVGLFRGGCLT